MGRPVQYNTNMKLSPIPEGYSGEGFMATSFDKVVGLARKNSLWPLPIRNILLRYRVHGNNGFQLRSGSFRVGTYGLYTPPVRRVAGCRYYCQENGSCCTPGIPANGRAALGYCHRCMRIKRWYIRLLSCVAGYRSGNTGRRVCGRLPSAPGSYTGWYCKAAGPCT